MKYKNKKEGNKVMRVKSIKNVFVFLIHCFKFKKTKESYESEILINLCATVFIVLNRRRRGRKESYVITYESEIRKWD